MWTAEKALLGYKAHSALGFSRTLWCSPGRISEKTILRGQTSTFSLNRFNADFRKKGLQATIWSLFGL